MQQAVDFLEESKALADVVEPLSEDDFHIPTQFKGWTIDDVIGHLHMFNVGALVTLRDGGDAFAAFFAPVANGMARGKTIRDMQYPWLDGLQGRRLFDAWRETFHEVARAYSDADPRRRLRWAGPDMSALSCITARQMETWAHGQEVFDVLGVERREMDRIRNIAHLGVTTFKWTFLNRGLNVPDLQPFVELSGPTGDVWTWGERQADSSISGEAVDFARVVSQVRNIADTRLAVRGDVAREWMAMAQCFAGPPETPPAPGTRFMA